LLDQRGCPHHAFGLADFGEHLLPVLDPIVVALDDRVAVEPVILSISSARKPFITLITMTSIATLSMTTPIEIEATSAITASPRPGSM
jgi:hypothetical protein